MEANLSPEASVLTWLSSSEELPPTLEEENRASQKINDYTPTSSDDFTKEILAAFKEHLPWHGTQALVSSIASDEVKDPELFQLAYHLYTAILLPFQAQTSHAVTPAPFVDSETCEEDVFQTMLESASRNDQGRLKRLCLQRDDWRCMLTKILDISQVKDDNTEGGATILAHIFPFSLGKWDNSSSEYRVAQIWATIHRLFPDVRSLDFGLSSVNNPENLMTLLVPLEISRGDFSLALQPMGKPNVYKILTFPGFQTMYNVFLPKPNRHGARIIEFQSHNGLPLPHPAILRAHASIAKVLKSNNNIFKRIQQILQMPETTRHLSTDGTTDLDFLFWRL